MRQNGRNRNLYVYGSAAAQPDDWRQPAEARPQRRQPAQRPAHRAEPIVHKNRSKARRMSIGYLTFLAAALIASAYVLVNYIRLQGDLTNVTRSVAAKESELNNLKVANSEEYNRIVSGIDLEEIKRVAIAELGMTYAREGQIIYYNSEANDYMRMVVND